MLDGFRILDLADEKGQLCARLLGDLGADVVKIEPPGGDSARRLGPYYHDEPHPEKSLYWFAYNTNKRGVTLNLDCADGRELFRRLVRSADVVLETFQPGYLAGLGLGYDDLKRIKNDLIMVSITPFGQTGPDAQALASDLVMMARGGLLYICGDSDAPPARVRVPQSYCQGGAQGAMATALALHHRDETGVGQHIDLSIQEAIANALITVQQNWDMLQRIEERGTRQRRGNVIGKYSWACADGYIAWCWWVAPGWGYKMYPLLEWMTEEEMVEDLWDWDWDSRSTNELNQEEVDHWEEVFTRFFLTHTKEEIFHQALERRIMLFPTYSATDLTGYEQLADREYFQSIEHPELGDAVTYPGAFVVTTEPMWSLRLRPPMIGEHNREIYGGELQLGDQDLAALKAAGAI
ncbi:MAG: CoA transferase [Chloroflexi bacterium]|nr:CoA transferase [Chloroflexota bacterium]MCI0770063.1 CoA transferase [Chloroflexota bacterium]